jgi:hypothetical protein
MTAPEAQSLKKIKRKEKSKASPWHWRSVDAGPLAPFVPREKTGAEKDKKQMIEQIDQTNRERLNIERSFQVRRGDAPTVGAPICRGGSSTRAGSCRAANKIIRILTRGASQPRRGGKAARLESEPALLASHFAQLDHQA